MSDNKALGDDELFLGSADESPIPPPPTVPWTSEKARENMRGWIAISLVALLSGTVIASFLLLAAHPEHDKELHELLSLILAPLVALVGTATGYYFGSQSAAKQ